MLKEFAETERTLLGTIAGVNILNGLGSQLKVISTSYNNLT